MPSANNRGRTKRIVLLARGPKGIGSACLLPRFAGAQARHRDGAVARVLAGICEEGKEEYHACSNGSRIRRGWPRSIKKSGVLIRGGHRCASKNREPNWPPEAGTVSREDIGFLVDEMVSGELPEQNISEYWRTYFSEPLALDFDRFARERKRAGCDL